MPMLFFLAFPDVVINRYQQIQNMAAKIVLNCSKYDSATEALRNLHWLPIRAHIQYKVLIIMYKCLDNSAPDYLKDILVNNPVTRPGLKSEAIYQILIVPRTYRKTFASTSFSVADPQLWNSLADFLRTTEHKKSSKMTLKLLFKCYLSKLYHFN